MTEKSNIPTEKKSASQAVPTSWGSTFANAIGAGVVAGFAGFFGGIQWGAGVLVLFSLFIFPGSVKPFSRRFIAIAVALLIAVVVKVLIEVGGKWAFQ